MRSIGLLLWGRPPRGPATWLALWQSPEHLRGHLGDSLHTGSNALQAAHDGVEFQTQHDEAHEEHARHGKEEGTLATHEAGDFEEDGLIHG